MMDKSPDRRNFLKSLTLAGVGCCLLRMPASASSALLNHLKTKDKIVPADLNYCSYTCPDECQFLKGSLENDTALKKEAYKLWEIKERFKVPFDEDTIFCFGCKTKNKPEGIVLKNCTVRSCAMEKGYEACIECDALETCQKELWDRFPEFKKSVIELREKYLAQA